MVSFLLDYWEEGRAKSQEARGMKEEPRGKREEERGKRVVDLDHFQGRFVDQNDAFDFLSKTLGFGP